MRKKTVNHLCDNVFWYIVYMLPMLVYVVQYFYGGANPNYVVRDFTAIMQEFSITSVNIIADVMENIFGANGIMPLFQSPAILQFFAYFASCLIAHLAVDFVLFIPRLCHKWLNKFYQGD